MSYYKSEESRQRSIDAIQRGWINKRANNKIKEDEYYKNPNLCIQCGKPIFYDRRKNKYCSQSCVGLAMSFKFNKNHKPKKHFCIFCGKKIDRHSFKYCSFKCQSLFRLKEVAKKIECGENVSSSSLRKYLMLKYDSKCQKCGWGVQNPTSGTVCLDMHHADGNANNNVLSNVEILCPNCHSLTDTYKRVGKNRKSSRINRK
jgi:predicted nucleic acid-binding Zn ribbon protein